MPRNTASGQLCQLVTDWLRKESQKTCAANHKNPFLDAMSVWDEGRLASVSAVHLRPYRKSDGHPVLGLGKLRKLAQWYTNDRPKFSENYRLVARLHDNDKTISRAIAAVVRSILEGTVPAKGQVVLSPNCYAYRQTRQQKDAILDAEKAMQQGYLDAARFDVSSYFDNIRHDVLLELLGRVMRTRGLDDPLFLDAVARLLNAPRRFGYKAKRQCPTTCKPVRCDFWDRKIEFPAGLGIPQGSPLSAPLSNLYLNDIDHLMVAAGERQGFRYFRFADDIFILAKTAELAQIAGETLLSAIQKNRLDLAFNEDKCKMDHINNGKIQYLGFRFLGDGQGKRIDDKKVEKFRNKIKRVLSLRERHHLVEQGNYSNRDLLKHAITRVNKRIMPDYKDPATGKIIASTRSFVNNYKLGQDHAVLRQLFELDRTIRHQIARFVTGHQAQTDPRQQIHELIAEYNRQALHKKEPFIKLVRLVDIFHAPSRQYAPNIYGAGS